MEKVLIEIDNMSTEALELAVLCGVLNVKALDRMIAPLLRKVARSHRGDMVFIANRVSYKVTQAENKIARTLEIIRGDHAGDVWTNCDSVDLDIEDCLLHSVNPWAEIDADLDQEFEWWNEAD